MSKRLWIPRWVANHCLSSMGQELHTLIVLTNHANKEGITYPSVSLIAKTINASSRTVRRHLRLLEQRGLISAVSSKAGGHHSNVTRYRLFTQTWLEYQKAIPETPTEDTTDPPVDNLLKTDEKQPLTEDNHDHDGGQNESERRTPVTPKVIVRSNSFKGIGKIGDIIKGNSNDKGGALKGTAKTAYELTSALAEHVSANPSLLEATA